MKKYSLILFTVLLALGCSSDKSEATKEYLIVDQSSNKIINRYEYTEDTNELVRAASYGTDEEIEKQIEYEYDDSGILIKAIESVPGQEKRIITYETAKEFDGNGKLVKLIRTSSDGEVMEYHFGYDDEGTLRGVVEKDSDGNLLMQDY